MKMRNLTFVLLATLIAISASGCSLLEERRVKKKKASYPVELVPPQHAIVKAADGYIYISFSNDPSSFEA